MYVFVCISLYLCLYLVGWLGFCTCFECVRLSVQVCVGVCCSCCVMSSCKCVVLVLFVSSCWCVCVF